MTPIVSTWRAMRLTETVALFGEGLASKRGKHRVSGRIRAKGVLGKGGYG